MKPPEPSVTNSDQPILSVIIPSYNRCVSLKQTVLSLYQQEYPFENFEVVVVLDGGSDDSAEMLAELNPPFQLTIVDQANQGSAVARNYGADRSNGEILVFMDDDMEASASFLSEHAQHHAGSEEKVVLGYFTCDTDTSHSYFVDQLRGWWAAIFRRMRSDGHRFAYTDLMSGNFSVSKKLFLQVGGFKKELIRHHDYELGYRFLAAGAEFVYNEAAATIHHERSTLHRTLMGKVAEGLDDVLLGRMYPNLIPVLPMFGLRKYLQLPSRIMMLLAFTWPALSDLLAKALESVLGPIERLRRFGVWLRIVSALLIYWYWRGIAKELKSVQKLNEFLSAGIREPEQQFELIIHLEEGVDAAASRLDQARPAAANLVWRDRLIGRVPALPGTERLRGRHLRPFLAHQFHAPLFHILNQENGTGFPVLDDGLRELAEQGIQFWEEPHWRV